MKIPKKVLKWRAKQPAGAIMSPKKFHDIEVGASKSPKVDNPKAVAGARYWEKVMEKFHKKHCDAEPL